MPIVQNCINQYNYKTTEKDKTPEHFHGLKMTGS
jgi:hypothetical protein